MSSIPGWLPEFLFGIDEELLRRIDLAAEGIKAYWYAADQLISNRIRERCKKNKEKKLTGVSFTHTYTPVKANIFPFFPQAYMEN